MCEPGSEERKKIEAEAIAIGAREERERLLREVERLPKHIERVPGGAVYRVEFGALVGLLAEPEADR